MVTSLIRKGNAARGAPKHKKFKNKNNKVDFNQNLTTHLFEDLHQNSASQDPQNAENDQLLYIAFLCPLARNLPNISTFNAQHNIKTFIKPNTFLKVRSAVFSGAEKSYLTEPIFNDNYPRYNCRIMFPIKLNAPTVALFKNNFIIVEVWHKDATGSKLLGLIKIPTHQWYLSLEDESVAKIALKSKYPLVNANGFLPIVNVFTGENVGDLKLLICLGTDEQVEKFSAENEFRETGNSEQTRGQNLVKTSIGPNPSDPLVKHRAEQKSKPGNIPDTVKILNRYAIEIDCLKNLPLNEEVTDLLDNPGSTTEIFVTYNFVDQVDPDSQILLKSFKTGSSVFNSELDILKFGSPNNVKSHEFVSEVLGSVLDLPHILASQVPSGYVEFQVWAVKFNHIQKLETSFMLANSKLEISNFISAPLNQKQIYNLPLKFVEGEDLDSELKISLQFSSQQIRSKTEMVSQMLKQDKIPFVDLSLKILKICGLRGLLENLYAEGLWPEEISGKTTLSVYAIVKLPFFNTEAHNLKRSKSCVVGFENENNGSFMPTWDYEIDINLPLLMINQDISISLAEIFYTNFISIEFRDEKSSSYIGACNIPLRRLLHQTTGYSSLNQVSWVSLSDTQQQVKSNCSVNFGLTLGKKSDRDLMIDYAEKIDWCLPELDGLKVLDFSLNESMIDLGVVVGSMCLNKKVLNKLGINLREGLQLSYKQGFWKRAARK